MYTSMYVDDTRISIYLFSDLPNVVNSGDELRVLGSCSRRISSRALRSAVQSEGGLIQNVAGVIGP